MGGNRRTNKARNQTKGDRRHEDDADWFKAQKKRNRKRNKDARAARKKNR